MAAIAATVGNNVYMNRKGVYQLRPNMFVMLMAPSGLGKGFPVNLAKKLVTLTKATRVIAGRSSIQAIVQDLATQKTSEDNVPLFKDSRGFIVSSEFSTALIQDPDALTILTDLYDCHWNEEWTNRLKHSALETIINPNVTLLGGSSPSHFFDSIPDVNITGGFVGRMLIIHEEKRSKINDLMSNVEGEVDTKDFTFPYNDLSKHLIKISNDTKEGKHVFTWTQDAARVWKAWYPQVRAAEHDDKTGFNQRLPDHVLKAVMCLSLAESTDIVIRSGHIEEAIEVVSALAYTTKRVSEGRGKDPLAPQAKIILDIIISAPGHQIMRKKLLQKGYGEFDSASLDRIMDNMFTETGWIVKERIVAGNKADDLYKMTPEAIKQYMQLKEKV